MEGYTVIQGQTMPVLWFAFFLAVVPSYAFGSGLRLASTLFFFHGQYSSGTLLARSS